MPFCLTTAPVTFQGLLDILLSGYRWRTCLVFLDDSIIFSRTFEDFLRHVREILGVFKNDGLSFILNLCQFFKESVGHLGHIIWPGKLQVALKNTEAVT